MATRALVVDDDLSSQLLLERMLHKIDSEMIVVCVGTAEEAFYALNESFEDGAPFQVVFADLQLPGSNGFTLRDIVLKYYPKMEFLMISGVSNEKWYQRIAEMPASAQFFRKPVSEKQLRLYWTSHFNRLV